MTEDELKDMLYKQHVQKQKQNRAEACETMQTASLSVTRMAGSVINGANAIKDMKRALWQCRPKKKFAKKRTPIRQQTYVVV